MNLFKKVLDILSPLTSLVDSLTTSDEERLQAKAVLLDTQARLLSEVIEFEKALAAKQAEVITTEAQSDSWLTKSWRPITMLVLLSLVVLSWFGVGPQPMPSDLWDIIKIGLGGYIGGRSLEKITKEVTGALKKKEEV